MIGAGTAFPSGAAEIFAHLQSRFPARFKAEDKRAFLAWCAEFFRAAGYPVFLREEGGGVNLLAGSLLDSELVVSAHYDTSRLCRRSFYSTCDGDFFGRSRQFFTSLASALSATRKDNPTNANDNTSGVAAALAIAALRPPRTCYLLTDGEERGNHGARAFCRNERETMKTRLFLALDCVGVGKSAGVLYYRAYNRGYAEDVARRLSGGGYDAFCVQPRGSFATDAECFMRSVCVSAFSVGKGGRRYFTDIHTPKDVRADAENLEFFAKALARYAEEILS